MSIAQRVCYNGAMEEPRSQKVLVHGRGAPQRRWRWVVLTLVVAALFSCGPERGTPGRLALWQSRPDPLLTDMAAKVPLVTGLTVVRGDWASLWSAGKTPPDLLVLDQGPDLVAARKAGRLANLTTSLQVLTTNGRTIPGLAASADFVPSSYYAWQLYYSPSALRELGLAVPKDFPSWQKVMAAFKAKGKIPLALGASFNWPALAWVSFLDLHLNGPSAYLDLLVGKRSFDSPSMVAALATLESWRDQGWIDPNQGSQNWPEALAKVVSGQAGFVLLGRFATAREGDKTKLLALDPLPFPEQVSGAQLVSVQGFAVSSGSRAVSASLALADAYIAAGSPGQVGDAFHRSVLTAPGAGPVVPCFDAVWPAATVERMGLLLRQFLQPESRQHASALASSLKSLQP